MGRRDRRLRAQGVGSLGFLGLGFMFRFWGFGVSGSKFRVWIKVYSFRASGLRGTALEFRV